jgi:hypothetical protein
MDEPQIPAWSPRTDGKDAVVARGAASVRSWLLAAGCDWLEATLSRHLYSDRNDRSSPVTG